MSGVALIPWVDIVVWNFQISLRFLFRPANLLLGIALKIAAQKGCIPLRSRYHSKVNEGFDREHQ
jgi:hypothetical protein